MARPKPGPGRGAWPAQGDVTPEDGGRGPQARSSLSPGIQPAAFPLTGNSASGRLEPQRVPLFRPSVVTQVQQPDPRASGPRGVARPKPGLGRGAWPAQGDVNPCRWRPGSSSPIKPVSWNATSSLPANWEGCFGEAGPPRVAFSGPSVVTLVPDPTPGPVALGAWLDPSLGWKEGRGRRKGT